MLSPAFVAVMLQVPVPVPTCSLPLTIEHAVDPPTSNVSAPVPEPPEVRIVASAVPNVAELGPVTVSVAWSALRIVTGNGGVDVVGL